MAAGSQILAAPFQNKARVHLAAHFKKVFLFVVQVANSAGYLAGTDPARGPDETVEAGMGRIQELMQRPDSWTTREQDFVREWFTALWERQHGNGNS